MIESFVDGLGNTYNNSIEYIKEKDSRKMIAGIFIGVILVLLVSSLAFVMHSDTDEGFDDRTSIDNSTIEEDETQEIEKVENLRIHIYDDEINNTKTITDTRELSMSIDHDSIDKELQYRWSIDDGYESLESTDGQEIVYEFEHDAVIDGTIDRDTYYVTAYVDDIENDESYSTTVTIYVDEDADDSTDDSTNEVERDICSNLDGEGTISNPYEVYDSESLNCIEDNLSSHYIQTADIDLSNEENAYGSTGFDPIGSYSITGNSNSFTGSYDGQDYTISNLNIVDYESTTGVGLFATAENAELRNMTIEDVSVEGGAGVGGLVGYAENIHIDNVDVDGVVTGDRSIGVIIGDSDENSIISNSYAHGQIQSYDSAGGGLVGQNSGEISNSNSDVTVVGEENAGGLVGRNAGIITDSYSIDSVTGYNRMGGLVGSNSGDIIDSYATGDVNGQENSIGGLVGSVSDGTVSNSYATGSVEGDTYIGGLAGFNGGTITDTYAIGSVNGEDNVGGLVGWSNTHSSISASYSAGSVTGQTDRVGGFVGNYEGGDMSASYWDTESSDQSIGIGDGSGNAVGLETAEMQGESAEDNMSGFDFTSTWHTVTGEYPELQR